jgi:hypothetical protein
MSKQQSITKRLVAVLAVTALALAACGGEDADPTRPLDVGNAPTTEAPGTGGNTPLDDDPGGTVITGMGPGISVAGLLAAPSDGPFLVNGYVFVAADGSVVISDAIAESYPPQPAGAQVSVEGVDLMALPLVEGSATGEIPTMSWTELPVQLLGDLVDGILVGSSTASA